MVDLKKYVKGINEKKYAVEETYRFSDRINTMMKRKGVTTYQLIKQGVAPKTIERVLKRSKNKNTDNYTIFQLIKILKLCGLRITIVTEKYYKNEVQKKLNSEVEL